MNALETIDRILESKLYEADLKYCFVDEEKHPYKIDGNFARPNVKDDFVDLETLLQCNSIDYAGVGISVQASGIFAIDVDKCFSIPFDISSADDRAKDILNRFKNIAYCEFSFSGKGLRIFFKMNIINDYSKTYYIKNSSNEIEFYQPSNSFRYVTVTGVSIFNNEIKDISADKMIVFDFLNSYMKKPERKKERVYVTETRSIEELMKKVKYEYFTNIRFQDAWFAQAPGSGKNESEKDFQLIALIFENITTDKAMIKTLFESSPYFKSKDNKHKNKWEYNDYRYFEYIYTHL